MPQEKKENTVTYVAREHGQENRRIIRSTIIIPNYNGMQYIENCLRSLQGEPARILVVDNGSTDGSRELVEEKIGRAHV